MPGAYAASSPGSGKALDLAETGMTVEDLRTYERWRSLDSAWAYILRSQGLQKDEAAQPHDVRKGIAAWEIRNGQRRQSPPRRMTPARRAIGPGEDTQEPNRDYSNTTSGASEDAGRLQSLSTQWNLPQPVFPATAGIHRSNLGVLPSLGPSARIEQLCNRPVGRCPGRYGPCSCACNALRFDRQPDLQPQNQWRNPPRG